MPSIVSENLSKYETIRNSKYHLRKKKKKVTNIKQVGVLKDVRAQKLPRTDFFKTLTAGRK